MKRFFILIFIAFTLLSCREEVVNKDEIYLRFQPKRGEIFETNIDYIQIFNYSQNGNAVNILQKMFFKINSSIDTTSKYYITNNRYEKFKLEQLIKSGADSSKYKFDSDDPDSAIVQSQEQRIAYIAMKNLQYKSFINGNGKLIKTESTQKQILQESDAFFLGVVFPEYDLKIGNDWTHEILMRDSTKNIDGYLHFTLKSFNSTYAEIVMDGEFNTSMTEGENIVRKKIKQSGIYTVRRKDGWVSNGKIDQKIIYTPSDKKQLTFDIQNTIIIKSVQKS